jgi:hypothetical protein
LDDGIDRYLRIKCAGGVRFAGCKCDAAWSRAVDRQFAGTASVSIDASPEHAGYLCRRLAPGNPLLLSNFSLFLGKD